jgi:6-phospho-3-hexuloisomerase
VILGISASLAAASRTVGGGARIFPGSRKSIERAKAMSDFKAAYSLILDEIRSALDPVDPRQVDRFVEAVLSAEKIFMIGVGRVMLSLQAMAKRFNHLGICAHCVGDINEPAITDKHLLVIGSGSGESVVPVAIAKVAKAHHARIAHIGSNPDSTLAPMTDVFVRIPVQTKLKRPGEVQSQQIMTSLFEQALLLFGDAVALTIALRQGLDVASLWAYHANLE